MIIEWFYRSILSVDWKKVGSKFEGTGGLFILLPLRLGNANCAYMIVGESGFSTFTKCRSTVERFVDKRFSMFERLADKRRSAFECCPDNRRSAFECLVEKRRSTSSCLVEKRRSTLESVDDCDERDVVEDPSTFWGVLRLTLVPVLIKNKLLVNGC